MLREQLGRRAHDNGNEGTAAEFHRTAEAADHAATQIRQLIEKVATAGSAR
jgi:hypothetical protein